jgi:hypothetical protein
MSYEFYCLSFLVYGELEFIRGQPHQTWYIVGDALRDLEDENNQ